MKVSSGIFTPLPYGPRCPREPSKYLDLALSTKLSSAIMQGRYNYMIHVSNSPFVLILKSQGNGYRFMYKLDMFIYLRLKNVY